MAKRYIVIDPDEMDEETPELSMIIQDLVRRLRKAEETAARYADILADVVIGACERDAL